MKIDAQHVDGASLVLMVLETGPEARYTNAHLARIAFSQDRLQWLHAGTVSAESARLRRLPRDRRYSVLKLGTAVAVSITPA
jgi:hypothetical protein